MILRVSRWFVRILFVLAFAGAAAALWLLTTDSGTRFLLARAEAWIPDELTISDISGSLIGGLSARSVDWRSDTFQLSADGVDVDANLIELWALNVGVDSLRVADLSMSITPGDEADGDPFEGFVSPVPISITVADVTRFNIDVDGTVFAARDISLAASLEASALEASLYLNSDLLTGNVQGNGSLAPPYAFDLELTRVTMNFGEQLGTQETDLSVSGTADAYEFDGVSNVFLMDWPDAFVEVSGNGDLSRVSLGTITVDTEAGTAEGSGDVTWRPDISWDIAFAATSVDVDRFRSGIEMVADAAGRASGTWADGAVRNGQFLVDSATARVREFTVTGRGGVGIDGDAIQLTDIALATGSLSALVNGRAAPSLDLQVDAASSDLATLLPDSYGTAEAGVRVIGPPDALEITGTAYARSIGWRDIDASKIDVTFDVGADESLELHLTSSEIVAFGQPIETIALDVTGWLADHEFRTRLTRSDAMIALKAAGGVSDDEWRGTLSEASIVGPQLGSWQLQSPASARFSDATSELEEACLSRADIDGLICANLGLIAGEMSTYAVTVEDFPLAGLPLPLPETMEARGRIYLDASGAFDDDGVDGDLSLDIRGAQFSTEFEGEIETVAFSRLGGSMAVVDDAVETTFAFGIADDLGNGELVVELASIRDVDAPMSGNASLTVSDLSGLAILMPDIDEATGYAEGRFDIAGTPAAPVITGSLALVDGSFRIPQAGIDVTDVQIEVGQSQPGSLSVTGHAVSGEGSMRINGRTYIDSIDGLATELDIVGENVEIVRLPDLTVDASPDIRLFVNDGRIEATGTLLIPHADVQAQTLPETARRPSRDTVVVGREDDGVTTRRALLDVDVQLGDVVNLDAFGLTTGLEGSLRLQASPDAPLTGSGRINLREGRFEAYGQDLEVDRGELFFNGPLTNPLFDVRAVRRVTNVSAGIHLTGTPGRFNSELYSDPPMSEAETLSYLLTGRPLTNANSTDGDLMNQAAFALGVSQAGAITSQVRTSLGLETLTVEGTLDDSRIIAGTRIGGRLLVEYGYGLADQLGTLILKYQLNERLTLESSTGTVSTIDLKYNVRRK